MKVFLNLALLILIGYAVYRWYGRGGLLVGLSFALLPVIRRLFGPAGEWVYVSVLMLAAIVIYIVRSRRRVITQPAHPPANERNLPHD